MPSFNIVKESKFNKSFRTESIKGQFDLNHNETIKEQFYGNINIEDKDWSIGIIVGGSGTGKSTIAKELFSQNYIDQYKYDSRPVIDNMPDHLTVLEIQKMFNSVGFATVWSWLKPYHVLSNGEKMRVDLARSLLTNKDLIVFDEFTSVVDRTIAKTASAAISKAVKKTNKKFIAVSCHYDIIDWLEPDWIYDTNKSEFFFAKTNTNDQKSKLTYEKQAYKHGHYLESITI